ncbi:hypothetical protein FPQ18DRAFT_321902 [Pyronema domesticum]|uniref:CDP-diacylglycerol--glycerol-3-phosphate 3-phosphatidyltransferase n=1 Tax=Pyronema omphalodes (strain CBS 100304) TaxID=1076935 RepID=U4LLU0_PYROM|nr:hypothetical protein FPQ18DRAFT_321902 [Pyronema domesticum]CCX32898.1 Similar to CDP-diacylglycerol--glycerol-3-phosphate 3-phosphatidyltransferase; acc. no. P79001 [Pyronema omphalodes CBS 100304]
MIVTCLRPAARRLPAAFTGRYACPCTRRFIASGPPSPAPAVTLKTPVLGSLTNELDKIAPRFEVDAEKIEIIRGPADFYSALKERILKAKKRIFLSTLYVGKTEHDLIDTLRQALAAQPELRVSVLSDALRGTRETPKASCASLLAPLIEEFGDRVTIRLYHTPNFNGFKKQVVPKRLNEGWGLQHMKLYGIDDEIIMSGANLSTDYFTNRQDRYHIFSCGKLTDYYERIHNTVCSISYRVLPGPKEIGGYTMDWPETNPAPIPIDEPENFKKVATSLLTPLLQPSKTEHNLLQAEAKTVIYPLGQFTPILPVDTSTEHPALSTILRALADKHAADSKWVFTAGYFNIHPQLKQLLLDSTSKGTVITAAPEANGFYGSKGISNMLPPAYTLLARRFLDDVIKNGKQDRIELREWKRGIHGQDPDAWTYHAKGVWVTMPGEKDPSITLIGSSNYTKRSYSLDIEMNALVVTKDDDLKKRLGSEIEWLKEDSKAVTIEDFQRTERRVSLKVRLALWLVGAIGGQL